MTSEIPDLWDNSITIDVLTPATILNYQVEKLKQKTKGILVGELTHTETDSVTTLSLDLLAPRADSQRLRILQVKYKTQEVYPVAIAGAGLNEMQKKLDMPLELTFSDAPASFQTIAYTEEEFIDAIAIVLKSGIIRAKMQSLIAKSNEVKTQPVG